MSPLRSPLFLWILLIGLTGCTSSTPSPGVSATGAMQLAVYLPDALPADVSRVTVTVSGSDISPLSVDLALTDGAWGGVLSDLPAGLHRTFLARAYTSSNTLRYQGQADDVTVTAGATGLVSLTLQDVSAPPPFSNEAPLIDSLVASATTVAPGSSLSLTSTAHDPNAGDTLTYSWSAPSGSFSAPTLANTNWTAPSSLQGPVQLTLKVSDSRGASLSASLTVNVSSGTGADQVTVGFNIAPRVVSLTSSQSLLDVGQQTALFVSATDADGDSLSYQWTATCSGSFTGATSTSATFTPSALPSAACNNCQLVVTVKDGRGGTNTGSLALCVARDTRRAPPSLTRSFQSSLTAKASQQLTFEVGALDPAGSTLSFAWTANAGTLGTASTSTSSSRDTWTAPSCIAPDGTPSITATVSNAYGLKTARSFTVTGLPTCATSSGWSTTGSMNTNRSDHGAVLLSNGKVLILGGTTDRDVLATAEVYDPAAGTWSPTGSMASARYRPMVAALSTGKVLVAGGSSTSISGYLKTAELYDPATGTWSPTGSMAFAHGDAMVRLPDGRVLAMGGYGDGSEYTTASELYDPATGIWSLTGSLSALRSSQTVTLLSTGKVLITGGSSYSGFLNTSEVYDPATGTWSPTGSMVTARFRHAATLLQNGKVLVTGGYNGTYLAKAELYDPATGTWSSTPPMTTQRNAPVASLLLSGKVLITQGDGGPVGLLNSSELYDPITNTWSSVGPLSAQHYEKTATRLPSGRVLITGGNGDNYSPAITTEVYTP